MIFTVYALNGCIYKFDLFPHQAKFSGEFDLRLVSMILKFQMVSWCSFVEIRKYFLFGFGPRCLISSLPVVTQLCKCTLFLCLAWIHVWLSWFHIMVFELLGFFFIIKCLCWVCLALLVLTHDPVSTAQFKFLTGAGRETVKDSRNAIIRIVFGFPFFSLPADLLRHFTTDGSSLKKNPYCAQEHGIYCWRKFTQSITGNGVHVGKNHLLRVVCWYDCAVCFQLQKTLFGRRLLVDRWRNGSRWLPKLIANVVLRTS